MLPLCISFMPPPPPPSEVNNKEDALIHLPCSLHTGTNGLFNYLRGCDDIYNTGLRGGCARVHDRACLRLDYSPRTCPPCVNVSTVTASLRQMRVVEAEGGKLSGCAEPQGFTTEWRFYWPKLRGGELVWPLIYWSAVKKKERMETEGLPTHRAWGRDQSSRPLLQRNHSDAAR